MDDVLLRLADVGPFFTVAYGQEPPGPGYRPLTALYGGQLVPYVAEVGRRIGSGPGRVAASTAQFGIASRLWSIGLGCAALAGRVPDLAADRVWWRLPDEGSLQLWLPEPVGRPAEDLGASVLGNLAVLQTALRERYGVSPTVLRGNAASGLVGALRVLIDRVPGGAAPDWCATCWPRAARSPAPARSSTRRGSAWPSYGAAAASTTGSPAVAACAATASCAPGGVAEPPAGPRSEQGRARRRRGARGSVVASPA